MDQIVNILLYAAALDLYRRSNRREIWLLDRSVSVAMLDLCDWEARPDWLEK